jgi:hypothetical protein
MKPSIHYEAVEALCRGADYQDGIAAQERQAAEDMAKELDGLKARLAELQPLIAATEQRALDADRLAADFRTMAAEYCEANGWEMPEPKPAEASETAPFQAVPSEEAPDRA